MATTRKAASKVSTASISFKEWSDKLPFNPKTSEGSGFFPPFVRAISHILYALGITDDELAEAVGTKDKPGNPAKVKDIEAKITEELKEAAKHLNNIEISDNLSTVAREQLETFANLLAACNSEFAAWDKDTKVVNLTAVVNKAVGITAMLDRELIGLRTSDPGSSL